MFTDLIFFLKNHEKKNKIKIQKYLEIGFSHGFANTIFKQIFQF